MMKKGVAVIAMIALFAQTVYPDTEFQTKYKRAQERNAIAILMTTLGGAATAGGMIATFQAVVNDSEVSIAAGVLEIGGLITCLIGSFMWMFETSGAVYRWRIASENESTFTHREKKSIEEQSVFIGMSETAMLASYGQPDRINHSAGSWGSSKQYVYGYRCIYVESGRVTGWN